MRIGILTFHRAINYGAYLQAYSLSNELTERFRQDEVEIIDYLSPRERRNIFLNILRDIKRGGLVGGIRSLKKIAAFRRAQKRLSCSKKRFCTGDTGKLYDYIASRYDCLIIGSDAVFNWKQTGFPTPFIPDRKLEIPVLTYAASVHGMKYLEAEPDQIALCGAAFARMAFLGTRDACTDRFVAYCCPSAIPVHCCDPTVFLKPERLRLEAGAYRQRVLKKYGVDLNERYIVIMSPDNALIDELTRLYGSEYSFLHVFEGARRDKRFLYDLSPFEWAEVLGNAAAVVTRFFHGALLSLVHGAAPIVIDYSDYRGAYESKLKDLMVTRLGLPELYYDRGYAQEFSMAGHPEFRALFERMLRGEYRERIGSAMAKEAESLSAFTDALSTAITQNRER